MKTLVISALAIALSPGFAFTQNPEKEKEKERKNRPPAARQQDEPAPGRAAPSRVQTPPRPQAPQPKAKSQQQQQPQARAKEQPKAPPKPRPQAEPGNRPDDAAPRMSEAERNARAAARAKANADANDTDRPNPSRAMPNRPDNSERPAQNANRDNPNRPDAPAPRMSENRPANTPANLENPAARTGSEGKAKAKGNSNPNTAANRPKDDPEARTAQQKVQQARAAAQAKAGDDTRRVLADRARDRNYQQERERAREIDDDDDAKTILYSVLGGAAAGAIAGNIAGRDRGDRYYRLPPDQVGRDPRDRDYSVDYLRRRFRGNASWDDAPPSWRYYDRGDGYGYDRHYHPHYFNGNRRVVYYNTYDNIPPVLLASQQLNRLQVTTVSDSPYRLNEAPPDYYQNVPADYRSNDAYAVSYEVDPDSAVILDDILFVQGSTDFADAYSYDLVADLAEAMGSEDVGNERFIVEGHASAEGDYNTNLELSQRRAERIARDLVNMGVSPDRLVPVGYGETEARVPADASEEQRSLDRRVMVFRLAE